MKKVFAIFGLIMLAAAPAFASVQATAEVEPATAHIGERVYYIITLTGEDAAPPVAPKLADPAPFHHADTEVKQTDTAVKIVFTLVPFSTGRLTLPSYAYHWTDKNGNPQTAAPTPPVVEITPVTKDGEEPDPDAVADPLAPKTDWRAQLPYLIGGLLLLAALLAVWRYYRKKQATAPAPVAPPVPPHRTALNALDRLKTDKVFEREGPNPYFTAVSQTVRRYIEERYHHPAMELTTDELAVNFPSGITIYKEEMLKVLNLCDRAKFARERPTLEDADKTWGFARDFVEKTARKNGESAEDFT